MTFIYIAAKLEIRLRSDTEVDGAYSIILDLRGICISLYHKLKTIRHREIMLSYRQLIFER